MLTFWASDSDCISSVDQTAVAQQSRKSRHAVVCQRPRKPLGTQVCYLRKPLLAPFQPIVV